jgi:hypothetical protein
MLSRILVLLDQNGSFLVQFWRLLTLQHLEIIGAPTLDPV